MQGGAHLVAQGIHPEHHGPARARLHPLGPDAGLGHGAGDQPARLLQGISEAPSLFVEQLLVAVAQLLQTLGHLHGRCAQVCHLLLHSPLQPIHVVGRIRLVGQPIPDRGRWFGQLGFCLIKSQAEGGSRSSQIPLQPSLRLGGIGGLAHQPEAALAGLNQLLGFSGLSLGQEDIDAAQQELLFAGEGVDRAEHARAFVADQLAQAQLLFHPGGDGDVGTGVVAAQGLHIGEGVLFCGLAHRQGLLGKGGELIAMPVVEELMQQQGTLGTLAPLGQGGLCWKAEAPAAVEQILQFALQALGADAGIKLIRRQPQPSQLGIFGRAAHAAELLAEQGLELAESTLAGLLQSSGDVAVGEIGPFEQLLHLLGLHHFTQVDAGPVHQLRLEHRAGADQLQEGCPAIGLLTLGQVDEQGIWQISTNQGFELVAKRKQAGASHNPLGLQLTKVQPTGCFIAGLAGCQSIQQRAQLLSWVEQQHHSVQAELAGELLTEASVQLVRRGSKQSDFLQHCV